jgi:hypothetical protein
VGSGNLRLVQVLLSALGDQASVADPGAGAEAGGVDLSGVITGFGKVVLAAHERHGSDARFEKLVQDTAWASGDEEMRRMLRGAMGWDEARAKLPGESMPQRHMEFTKVITEKSIVTAIACRAPTRERLAIRAAALAEAVGDEAGVHAAVRLWAIMRAANGRQPRPIESAALVEEALGGGMGEAVRILAGRAGHDPAPALNRVTHYTPPTAHKAVLLLLGLVPVDVGTRLRPRRLVEAMVRSGSEADCLAVLDALEGRPGLLAKLRGDGEDGDGEDAEDVTARDLWEAALGLAKPAVAQRLLELMGPDIVQASETRERVWPLLVPLKTLLGVVSWVPDLGSYGEALHRVAELQLDESTIAFIPGYQRRLQVGFVISPPPGVRWAALTTEGLIRPCCRRAWRKPSLLWCIP